MNYEDRRKRDQELSVSDAPQSNKCNDKTCRMNAHGYLIERIAELRNEADRLERLVRSLPAELPFEADQALCDLVQNQRRFR